MVRYRRWTVASLLAGFLTLGCVGNGEVAPESQDDGAVGVRGAPTSDDADAGGQGASGPSREEAAKALEAAYADSSAAGLLAFLDQWRDAISPADVGSIDEPTIRDVYEVYAAFFDPFALERVGKSEWGNEIYKDVKYVIVQDSIRFRVGTDKEDQWRTVEAFRPPVRFARAGVLLLTPDYRDLLTAFLGSESHPVGTGNIMAPARAKGESKKRLDFLNRHVKIHHGHWGGWHIETHPRVLGVVFSEDGDQATVHFRLIYQGGEAHLEKGRSGWELKRSELTWIE